MKPIGIFSALCAALFLSTARAEVLCTVLADGGTGKLIKQEGTCDKRVTAASTFKVPLSLMGFDAGLLMDEHAPAMPYREAYRESNPAKRVTTDPQRWMQTSVIWYSRQVTQQLGEARFRRYMSAFQYGNGDVSGDPGKHNGLTHAWLSSSLKISPLEQVAFLQNVVNRKLPVSAHAYDMTSRIMALGELPNGWSVYGKTGTGAPRQADGAEDWSHGYGWFVGWAAKDGRNVVFARLIQDEKKEPVGAGLRARDAFLQALPGLLGPLQAR
ncbi:beta-lactamase [Cupriavidus basilensis OR16]|uniref:Beta-lactamase n=1 Tax=Cupriavidus basilensis OR16 TaxID=1127483 RepID=H1S0N2_9BURK|nr:class D beta-lactamase [Cupriavidus basilensis]EHP43891.1 beta-lactamase [Cupriavidus basilensis OR16]